MLTQDRQTDVLVCILTVEATLRQRITGLQRYRQVGLRWLRSAKLYDKMAASQQAGRPHLLNDVLHYIQVCDCLHPELMIMMLCFGK